MELIKTEIPDVVIIKPRIFYDDRGCFFETYNEQAFAELGITTQFVQDNQSVSKKGVLRGLHFQNPPYAQAKLVRVVSGKVIDYAVDIRKGSPTYGKYVSAELSAENHCMFYIPAGFAHAFVALEDNTVFFYKCSNFYNKASEGCIRWDDPTLNIRWQIDNPIVSEKDACGELFADFQTQFSY